MTMIAAHQLGRYDINVKPFALGSHARRCRKPPWYKAETLV